MQVKVRNSNVYVLYRRQALNTKRSMISRNLERLFKFFVHLGKFQLICAGTEKSASEIPLPDQSSARKHVDKTIKLLFLFCVVTLKDR
jgi:hypothetical protein